MKHRLAVLLATCVAAFGAGSVSPPSPLGTNAAYAKPCGVGWVHASLSWGHKCLRRGQFCKSYADREYHRYRFHCHSGRLTR